LWFLVSGAVLSVGTFVVFLYNADQEPFCGYDRVSTALEIHCAIALMVLWALLYLVAIFLIISRRAHWLWAFTAPVVAGAVYLLWICMTGYINDIESCQRMMNEHSDSGLVMPSHEGLRILKVS